VDDADRAQRLQQVANDSAVRAARQSRRASMGPASRVCFNCDDPLPAGHRFCDVDCRDDYVKRQAKLENDHVIGRLK
jgi:hypothetical protein